MSLITLEDRLSDLERDRDAIAETLRSIRDELHDLRERVESGALGDRAEASRLLADVRYWLKAARETEAEIKIIRKEKAGIAHDYAIDLERARDDVRCRIYRLRDCCKE